MAQDLTPHFDDVQAHYDLSDDFFKMAYAVLPAGGVMLLHTITALTRGQVIHQRLPISLSMVRFAKFILTEIFPGDRLPSIDMVEERSARRVSR